MDAMKSKLFLSVLMLVALTACGKKPSFVDAPPDKESTFPRGYPRAIPSPGLEPGDAAEVTEDYVDEDEAE